MVLTGHVYTLENPNGRVILDVTVRSPFPSNRRGVVRPLISTKSSSVPVVTTVISTTLLTVSPKNVSYDSWVYKEDVTRDV